MGEENALTQELNLGSLDDESSALTTWPQELTWSGRSQNDLKGILTEGTLKNVKMGIFCMFVVHSSKSVAYPGGCIACA